MQRRSSFTKNIPRRRKRKTKSFASMTRWPHHPEDSTLYQEVKFRESKKQSLLVEGSSQKSSMPKEWYSPINLELKCDIKNIDGCRQTVSRFLRATQKC